MVCSYRKLGGYGSRPELAQLGAGGENEGLSGEG